MIKTILFDFGGCLDAPGIHSRTLFFDAFLAESLVTSSGREEFQEAYTRADQKMMATGEAVHLGLGPFNRWNATLIANDLRLDLEGANRAGDRVTVLMREYLSNSREALLSLQGKFDLGIISNFTGNLEVILREEKLDKFFSSITESYYAGASKPDLRIFQTALQKQKCAASECLYIGDNPVNDIAPAKKLGMKAILIHPVGMPKICGADAYVDTLRVLEAAIQKI